MKYFMTGATGFLGGRLARLLLSQGDELHVLVRRPHTALDLQKLGAVIFRGDIREKASMVTAMSGCDGVFHVAADYTIGYANEQHMHDTNVRGTHNVLSLMRELSIPAGVYTSSIAVNSDTQGARVDETYFFRGEHRSLYSKTKWEAHYNVAKSFIFEGLPLMIVQPSLVYGPGDQSVFSDILMAFLRRRLPLIPAESRFSWAHVDDVARGHLLAMEKGTPGESYILGGPDHSLDEVLEMASRLYRRRPRVRTVPPRIVRAIGSVIALVENHIRLPAYYTSEALLMSAGASYIATSRKAEEKLGYSSRGLESGLKGTLTDLATRVSSAQNQNAPR